MAISQKKQKGCLCWKMDDDVDDTAMEGCSFSNNNISKLYSNAQNSRFPCFSMGCVCVYVCIICMSECQFRFYMQISLETRPLRILNSDFLSLTPTLLSNSSVFSSHSYSDFWMRKKASAYSIEIWQPRDEEKGTTNIKKFVFCVFLLFLFRIRWRRRGSKIKLYKCA